ncbi:uncharacterized protein HMPREF1541_01040 [Cyphellophora europaea CBS 101466]|uniref:Uncharacterized protein n=1 Tax=Cyphellophora europaea (strain CBS 101466) TaxID=1220924 RepID=W2SDP6_CYPE1|nr:uncharacterized protein HMPREF1541_01040 [Cyphellophora europaea CBS 101466]ETN46851.1 hypothetical protein HMPREF1541_01040 [Cyphellophora europaea CBS 101466]
MLRPFLLLAIIFTATGFAQVQNIFIKSGGATNNSKMSASNPLNVFRQPLQLFSMQPRTGFYRDGYCRTGAADFGNHAVAGIVSEKFLDFSAEQGNDLRVAGLSEGCKWCLCTSRWMEAFQAYKDGRIPKEAVPKVQLSATEDSALNKVDLNDFREFAVKEESTNGANGVH